MKKLNLAAGIFVMLAIQGVVYGVDIAIRHGGDRTWPAHARYHVVLSGIHIVALALVTGVLAIGGLRRRRRTAWITLAIVSTVAWAAWPIARLLAGEPPPWWVQLVTLGSFGAAVAALALSFGPCFAGSHDGVPRRPSAPPIGE